MQLAILILAGIGALLFLVCFLGYVVAGFRHHFVTGLIATLPVLNIITLPSLWDKNSRKFILGFIGLAIFIGAWFMGADKGIQNLIARQNTNVDEEVIASAKPDNNSTITSAGIVSKSTKVSNATSVDEKDMLLLPNKALYKMGFEVVPVDQISTLEGRIVQITKTDNTKFEGRIKSVSAGSVILDGSIESEFPLASIKQLKLMVKKAN